MKDFLWRCFWAAMFSFAACKALRTSWDIYFTGTFLAIVLVSYLLRIVMEILFHRWWKRDRKRVQGVSLVAGISLVLMIAILWAEREILLSLEGAAGTLFVLAMSAGMVAFTFLGSVFVECDSFRRWFVPSKHHIPKKDEFVWGRLHLPLFLKSSFKLHCNQYIHLRGIFKRNFFHNWRNKSIHHHRHRFTFWNPSWHQIK